MRTMRKVTVPLRASTDGWVKLGQRVRVARTNLPGGVSKSVAITVRSLLSRRFFTRFSRQSFVYSSLVPATSSFPAW